MLSSMQHDILSAYVRETADMLGLKDWRIITDKEPDENPSKATNSPIDGRKVAHVRFPDGFAELDEFEQISTVVHELIHLHFAPCREVVRTDLFENRLVSHDAYALFCDHHLRCLEYGVDGMAAAIAVMLKPIDWQVCPKCGMKCEGLCYENVKPADVTRVVIGSDGEL
jgi:hypothetical protein